jgi:hypothetical protein
MWVITGAVCLTSIPLIFFAWLVMSSAARLLLPALLLITGLLCMRVRLEHLCN